MKYLIFALITSFIFSCTAPVKKGGKKTFSADVERSFEDIEREKAIELYRKLRWENWKDVQRKNTVKKSQKVTRKATRYYKPKEKIIKKIEKPALNESEVKEIQIEISQNMSFFCMANRKDRRFKDENECHAFTQNILDSCQEKVSQPWHDRKIVSCVKSQLR